MNDGDERQVDTRASEGLESWSSIHEQQRDDAYGTGASGRHGDEGDDGHQAYHALRPVTVEEPESPSEAEARYEREDWAREQHVLRERLADARLPFVDQLLYEKYILRPRADFSVDQQREMCHELMRVLNRHRQATLAVLRDIEARETVVAQLHHLCEDVRAAEGFASDGSGAKTAVQVDLQAQALRLLHQLRQKTLNVVEGIVAWRSNLNRPFPFTYKGRNYILKIASDCALLEQGDLGRLLPMQLTLHPLMANVPALNLFADTSSDTSAAAAGSAATAVRRLDRPTVPPPTATQQRKLEAVESYIRGELDAQLANYRDLLAICTLGCFVPVLNVPKVTPLGANGLRLMNAEWLDKVKTSLLSGLQELLTLPDALIAADEVHAPAAATRAGALTAAAS